MAIKRQQQRRGTAAQWTSANPTLNNGEFGYETDTKKLKIGDGSTVWASLPYMPTSSAITAAVNAVIDAAPGALDTLNELAAAMGDDPNFATTVTNALAGKQPLDADLTAIAALTTTAFGRGLLTAADAAALQSTLGVSDSIPIVLTPTGVATTDGPAMDAAVTQAQAEKRPIVLKAGVFRRTTPWDLRATLGLSITGAGSADPNSTIIECTVDTADLMYVGGFGMRLNGFNIRHNNFTPTDTTGHGIVFYKSAYSMFEDIGVWNAKNLMHIAQADVQDMGTSSGVGNWMFSNTFENIWLHNYSNCGLFLHSYNAGSTGSVWTNIYIQNGTVGAALTSTGNPVDLQGVNESVFNQVNIEDHAGMSLGILLNEANATFNSVHFERIVLSGWQPQFIRSYGSSELIVTNLTIAYCDVQGTGSGNYSSIGTVAAGGKLTINGVYVMESTKTLALPWYWGQAVEDTTAENALSISAPRIKTGSPAFTAPTSSASTWAKGLKRLGDVDYNPGKQIITGTVGTAIGTAAKTVTLDSPWASYAPVPGDVLALTYTNGNNVGSSTVAVNGGGARTVRLGGQAVGVYHNALQAGAIVMYRVGADGALNMFGSQYTASDPNTGATASTPAMRDTNASLTARNFLAQPNAVTASGTTVTMSITTNPRVIIGGSGGQVVAAPTTSVPQAYEFSVTNNQTSGTVTVNASGGTLIATLAVGQTIVVQALQATPTTNAHWKQIGGTYGSGGGGGGATTTTGTYASRGSGTTTGDVYYCTDTDAVYRWSGSAWVRVRFGVQGTSQAEPPSSGWTSVNLGTSTVVADKDSRLFTIPTQAAGARMEYRNPGSMTGAYTYTAQVDITAYPVANYNTGLFLRNSTSGNMVFYGLGWDGTYNSHTLMALTYNATAWNSTVISWGPHLLTRGFPSWFRIRDDGTNRNFEYSYNGVDWNTQLTHVRTTHITADQIGWGGDNTGTSTVKTRMRSLDFA